MDENQIFLNSFNTNNRANLMLINCSKFASIKITENLKLSIMTLMISINYFSNSEICQFYFEIPNFKNFFIKKIQPIEELHFDNIFKNYSEEVNQLYAKLNNKKEIYDEQFKKEIMTKGNDLIEKIIIKKFVYPTKYLKNKLNNNLYIDFIFKVVFIAYVADIYENFISGNISQIHHKLLINRDIIYNDKNLEIYEKIFLFLHIYLSKLLIDENFIIQYLHIKYCALNSPLYLCFQFLNKFVYGLSEISNFYYPLLNIKNIITRYKNTKKGVVLEFIKCFCFDMCSINIIQKNLKDIIPNIILLSKKNINEAVTCKLNGLIILNNNIFIEKNVLINENNKSKNIDEKYGFILLKLLINEIFNHKMSELCKNHRVVTYNKRFLFQDKTKNYRKVEFESKFFNFIWFNNPNKIYDNILNFYLGNIHDISIIEIFNEIQYKTNLGILLNPELWHYKKESIYEYIKLKFFIIENKLEEEKNEESLDIFEEIEIMKNLIKDKLKDSISDIDNLIKIFYHNKNNREI